MALATVYQGMTYTSIKDFAITIAKKHSIIIEQSEAISFFDEAMLRVGLDVLEADSVSEQGWPEPPTLNLITNGYLHLHEVFGDNVPLCFIPYETYRFFFLGEESNKPAGDSNIYYTVLGNSLLLEPNVTDFTNVAVHYTTRFTKYSERDEVDDTPEMPMDYRILVSYKICELMLPALFKRIYTDMLNKVRNDVNTKLATGQVEFWDPFLDSTPGRSGNVTGIRGVEF